MPLFKTGNKLVYFAHVPKCAGTAMEDYIVERFGNVAFLDRYYLSQPESGRWSRSSPQHIDAASLQRLIPHQFFDAVFAIVRHPVGRVFSVYRYQRNVERSIPEHWAFSDWLGSLAGRHRDNPYAYDNHTRPMAELIPEGARVFHLEDGLDEVVSWLDDLTGSAAGPRSVPIVNRSASQPDDQSDRISQSDIRLIAEIFAVDFDRFDYDTYGLSPLATVPTPNHQ